MKISQNKLKAQPKPKEEPKRVPAPPVGQKVAKPNFKPDTSSEGRRNKAMTAALLENKKAVDSLASLVKQQGELISQRSPKQWDVKIHRDTDGSIASLTLTDITS